MEDSKKNKTTQPLSKTFEKLHQKPVTRRDFLATGLIPFSASMILPSWMSLFGKAGVAEAAELVCGNSAPTEMVPFITLKLSGGAGLAANWIPLDKGGVLLPTYNRIGLGKSADLQLTYAFANKAPFWALSGVLTGIQTTAQVTTLAKTVFLGVPVRSQDDSASNKFDLSGMVARSGLAGKILPNLGRSNTETGLAALPALIKPSAPLVVSRYEDILGSLGVGGALGSLNQGQKEKLFSMVKRTTASQAVEIENLSRGKTMSKLLQCATISNEKLIANSNSQNTSPLGNAAFAAVWGINQNTSTSSQDFVFASMVFNALNGNAGTVNLDMGGYDYHDGTRSSGDTRDTAAGDVMGKVLESFAVMNKKGFLVVCSDGGVASSESDRAGAPWVSDRGTGGAMYMMAFDPTLAPKAKGTQLGHFTEGQVADDNFLTGGSPEKAAAAIFANYMSFNSKIKDVEAVIPRQFSPEELDLITVIA